MKQQRCRENITTGGKLFTHRDTSRKQIKNIIYIYITLPQSELASASWKEKYQLSIKILKNA